MRDLSWASSPPQPQPAVATVLYLHGGAVHSIRPVTQASLTFQRIRVLRDALAHRLAHQAIASVLLKYNRRGWNDRSGDPAPIADARWALDQICRQIDGPIVIVGHSMGARTGLRVADHPNVIGLVALAPWFPASEDISTLRDRHLSVIHGTHDRITSYRESRIVAERSEDTTASTSYQPMPGLGHYLLSSAAEWNRATYRAITHIMHSTCEQA